MVFGKLFGRKNNDNYNEDLLNQKRREAQKEIEAYKQKLQKEQLIFKENLEKNFNEQMDKLNTEKFEKMILNINKFLDLFKKQKEEYNENFKDFKDKEILERLLDSLKEDSINRINNLFNIYNVDKNSNKDVLEAYNKAIEEIENS